MRMSGEKEMIVSGVRIGGLIRQGRLLRDGVPYRVSLDSSGNHMLSYGTGFAGYDLRLGTDFLVFGCPRIISGASLGLDSDLVTTYSVNVEPDDEEDDSSLFPVIDPKNLYNKPGSSCWYRFSSDKPFYLDRRAFVLGESVETFEMEPNMIGLCFGKSTYARAGVLVNVTPIEPGWRGRLVIEIANLSEYPVKIYPGEGIAQVVFVHVDGDVSYEGKWQDQKPIAEVASHCREAKRSVFGTQITSSGETV